MKLNNSMKIIVNDSLQNISERAVNNTTRQYLPSALPFTIAGPFGRVDSEIATLSLLTLNHSVLNINSQAVIQVTGLMSLHLCYLLRGKGALINGMVNFNEEQVAYNFWPNAHYRITVGEGRYIFLLLEVKSELYPLLSGEYSFLQDSGKYRPRLSISDTVHQAIHQVLNIQESGELGRINLEAAANRLFFLTLKEVNRHAGRSEKIVPDTYADSDNALSDIAVFINDHLEEKLTIEMVARKFNLSRSKLLETFKSTFGQPLHEYIVFRRMEKAKALLQQGLSLSEICGVVGYPDKSNFVRAFRKASGITPALYRKRFFMNRSG
ncbi:AraC family transcriptional regulator [Chitinophaga pendula]|uniref:helix-turn-helix domain-containing protein n=1 Tax=Chitinophaga TaxID=79328 RepID=UPI000BB0A88D|nr:MULTISPECIES: AraC family transcriptional regulator [Chitinophaga]ASZ13447.1 hypothetical protein CK934_22045 [Chitinophaga sp. MD30]UCJ08927.1 AraC family transcriptional regulator [Chitinophaga pendula]